MVGRFALCLLYFSAGLPASAQAKEPACLLCGENNGDTGAETEIPLRIEVVTKLSFSRIALTGRGGALVSLDPRGASDLSGDAVPLGGYPLAGSVILSGEPGRSVRVDMPADIIMRSSNGGQIEIGDIRTTLGPAPRLDNAGRLEFSFGGRLAISGNLSGRFRGRIPVTANYE